MYGIETFLYAAQRGRPARLQQVRNPEVEITVE